MKITFQGVTMVISSIDLYRKKFWNYCTTAYKIYQNEPNKI